MPEEKFDLQKVQSYFERCFVGNDDVLIDPYLEAFRELNKFLSVMGTVFGFICNEIKEKVRILESLRHDQSHGAHFESVRKMMDYETSNGLVHKKGYISGCRTMQRLHRGLNFIYEFLKQLSELETADAKTSGVCQAAYNDTLAEFHPWIIRKGAIMAMYSLPTRNELLEKMCDDANATLKLLPEMLHTGRAVYDRTHALYTNYGLHGLP
ncbi:hypothetical protein RP20_CCG024033 [Aedes albopictus]|nr:hypothetical protein RP20_CCG024033 [Aedes albopictus]